MVIGDYMPHFGEEACLVGKKGSGAIFFSYCNLKCVFCQTEDVSLKGEGTPVENRKLAEIMLWLQNEGCHNINLITPTHIIVSIILSLREARDNGLTVPVIYNSGGYDKVEILRELDGLIDIYLPDFKFWSPEVAEKLCGAKNYPEVGREAIKEMHRQVGDLTLDSNTGLARRGLLVRHLVLPGLLSETENIMEFLAREISPDTYVNIMGHYHPCGMARKIPPLNRTLRRSEYVKAMEFAKRAGLKRLDKTHFSLYPLVFSPES